MSTNVEVNIFSQMTSNEILKSSLNFGAFSGASGLIFGSVAGILRSSHPVMFALASSLHWFALGSTFWASRGILLNTFGSSCSSPKEQTYASAAAGGITGGTVAALTRGRANVIPGTIMFSIFGILGQTIYNYADASHSANVELEAFTENAERQGFWHRVAEKRWTPISTLSDEKYQDILREKVVRVEAEIAILDEDLEKEKCAQEGKDEDAGQAPR